MDLWILFPFYFHFHIYFLQQKAQLINDGYNSLEEKSTFHLIYESSIDSFWLLRYTGLTGITPAVVLSILKKS